MFQGGGLLTLTRKALEGRQWPLKPTHKKHTRNTHYTQLHTITHRGYYMFQQAVEGGADILAKSIVGECKVRSSWFSRHHHSNSVSTAAAQTVPGSCIWLVPGAQNIVIASCTLTCRGRAVTM